MRLVASLSTLVALGVLAGAAPAAAQVPPTLQLAGRLTDAGGTPLHGTFDVELRLYGVPAGGTAVWTEIHDSVVADTGAVYLAPGVSTPFGDDVFDGSARWLEIRIDGTTLSPRLAVASVPYAFRADVAGMLGDYAPEDVQPRITNACAPGSSIRAIDDDGTLTCEPDDTGGIGDVTRVTAGVGLTGGGDAGDLTLAADTTYLQRRVTGCPAGSTIRAVGADGAPTCDTDDDTTYSAGAGVAITGTTVSLASTGCVAGEVWKWSGAAWGCEPDVDTNTVYSAGAGVAITGTTVSLASTGCAAGDVWKWSGSAWACEPDVDTTTTYSAGVGVAITGTTVSLASTGCVAGEVWKWSGTAWSCEPDSGTTYSAGAGVAITGTTVSLASAGCVAGEVWKWSGTAWSCEPDVDTSTTYSAGAGVAITGTTVSLGTAGCVAGEVWKWSGTAWSCEPDIDTSTTYSAGAGVAITGTTVSLSTTGCVAGEVWKWSGTAWACEPDANTSYAAGSGISLTGTTFATDNTVVARKDSAAGNQSFDSNTMFLDYTNNRIGLGTATPRERLDVEGPAELDTLRVFRKYGNNGTTSCEVYCRGDNWPGGTGVCLSAKANEQGPDGNVYRVYIGCDVVPGFGSAPACICGGIYD